jgi:hypothetical protein
MKMDRTKATAAWRNEHNKGKYVLCETRPEHGNNRLFIRTMTDNISDAMSKRGWWKTFTLSKEPVAEGLWLCEIEYYRTDKNGYLMMIVKTVKKVPKIAQSMLWHDENGTWNSPAIHMMVVNCRKFLSDYNFSEYRHGNIDAFLKAFPQYNKENITLNNNFEKMCHAVLMDWLDEKIKLKEIEDALNMPTEYESLLSMIRNSILKDKFDPEFEAKYPNFVKKIRLSENHGEKSIFWDYEVLSTRKIDDYITRNAYSYDDAVNAGKIKENNAETILDKVEAILQYRSDLKKQERLARKNAKKS